MARTIRVALTRTSRASGSARSGHPPPHGASDRCSLPTGSGLVGGEVLQLAAIRNLSHWWPWATPPQHEGKP